jgi:hypothetical protein
MRGGREGAMIGVRWLKCLKNLHLRLPVAHVLDMRCG